MTTTRHFEDKQAVRERVPLFVGLSGPSGGGKTYSALRIATGIAKVNGGPIFVIDTESRRSLHYAADFDFRHVAFGAPFSPMDYLAAIEHCVKKGAGVIVIDSMSHEHEGPGGVLEMHAREVERMSGGDRKKAERVKMLAWSYPKQQRRRLINSILQMPVHFVFCFRAGEKLEIKKGQDPEPLGWMPIAGKEYVYEMTVAGILPPGANGVPVWQSTERGEKRVIKHPGWSRDIVGQKQLDEDIGAKLAKWAEGTVQARGLGEIITALGACSDAATLGILKAEARPLYKKASAAEKQELEAAIAAATTRLESAVEPAPELVPEAYDDDSAAEG